MLTWVQYHLASIILIWNSAFCLSPSFSPFSLLRILFFVILLSYFSLSILFSFVLSLSFISSQLCYLSSWMRIPSLHQNQLNTLSNHIHSHYILFELLSFQVVSIRIDIHHCRFCHSAGQQLQRSHRHGRLLPLETRLQSIMGIASGLRSLLHHRIGTSAALHSAMAYIHTYM